MFIHIYIFFLYLLTFNAAPLLSPLWLTLSVRGVCVCVWEVGGGGGILVPLVVWFPGCGGRGSQSWVCLRFFCMPVKAGRDQS